MSQTAIPFLFMRGGTSRGPYLNRQDLPEDQETLTQVLISMVGSGHPLNIDGIGGGDAVTTKVAMLSRSNDEWANIDYFFAQVSVCDRLVDFKPTCGNILAGVGPAAIEMGLAAPDAFSADTAEIKIRAVNTGARVLSKVRTDGNSVVYEGTAAIDGVPGTAAPVELRFMDVVGGATGAMFPTGRRIDEINGINVSCIDVAIPMVIARAEDFGITGREAAAELDGNRAFYDRMEPIRRKAGALMGLGDVSESVVPKFGVLASANDGGAAAVRYFMPWKCHPSLAVTGAQCLSACLLCPGTVGNGLLGGSQSSPARLQLEHPMGKLEVSVEFSLEEDRFDMTSAGIVRTARKLAEGSVFVPGSIWDGIE